jgi:hypothetical protein
MRRRSSVDPSRSASLTSVAARSGSSSYRSRTAFSRTADDGSSNNPQCDRTCCLRSVRFDCDAWRVPQRPVAAWQCLGSSARRLYVAPELSSRASLQSFWLLLIARGIVHVAVTSGCVCREGEWRARNQLRFTLSHNFRIFRRCGSPQLKSSSTPDD